MKDAIEIVGGFAGGVAMTVLFQGAAVREAKAVVNDVRAVIGRVEAKLDRIIQAIKA